MPARHGATPRPHPLKTSRPVFAVYLKAPSRVPCSQDSATPSSQTHFTEANGLLTAERRPKLPVEEIRAVVTDEGIDLGWQRRPKNPVEELNEIDPAPAPIASHRIASHRIRDYCGRCRRVASCSLRIYMGDREGNDEPHPSVQAARRASVTVVVIRSSSRSIRRSNRLGRRTARFP